MVLWLLGYPDQALLICAEAQRYADALNIRSARQWHER